MLIENQLLVVRCLSSTYTSHNSVGLSEILKREFQEEFKGNRFLVFHLSWLNGYTSIILLGFRPFMQPH